MQKAKPLTSSTHPAKIAVPTALIGKGGVGLAMFHFARLGYEFTLTTDRSHCGDLWVHFKTGIEPVEVKASTIGSWLIRPEQISKVSRVVFVCMSDGRSWLVSSQNVLAACKEKPTQNGKLGLTVKDIERIADEDWHRTAVRVCLPSIGREAGGKPLTKRDGTPIVRVVRKALASGEVKEYRYPAVAPVVSSPQPLTNVVDKLLKIREKNARHIRDDQVISANIKDLSE